MCIRDSDYFHHPPPSRIQRRQPHAQQGLMISAPFVVQMVVIPALWKGWVVEVVVLLSRIGRDRA
eukprot:1643188-Alexandrium_andersonii.AAC.1